MDAEIDWSFGAIEDEQPGANGRQQEKWAHQNPVLILNNKGLVT